MELNLWLASFVIAGILFGFLCLDSNKQIKSIYIESELHNFVAVNDHKLTAVCIVTADVNETNIGVSAQLKPSAKKTLLSLNFEEVLSFSSSWNTIWRHKKKGKTNQHPHLSICKGGWRYLVGTGNANTNAGNLYFLKLKKQYLAK